MGRPSARRSTSVNPTRVNIARVPVKTIDWGLR
jgi:hypothetical protein